MSDILPDYMSEHNSITSLKMYDRVVGYTALTTALYTIFD